MHEISVLYKMLDQVEIVARDNNVSKIRAIEIEIGELSGMLPYFFEQYYGPATENKELFSGSELKIKSVPGEGLCHECGSLYNVMRFEGKCPKCGSRDKKIISGREFKIRNIQVDAVSDTAVAS